MKLISSYDAILSLRLLLALILGAAIGAERKRVKGNPAIMRANIFICVGSAIVSAAGIWLSQQLGGDPARIAAQVIGSIGFLGMGVIFKHGHSISGLTTAASLWITGCVGVAVGLGAYLLATTGTIIVLATLGLMRDRHNDHDEDYDNGEDDDID